MSKQISIRLLSENFSFCFIGLFFYVFFKGFEERKRWLQILSAIILGTLILNKSPTLLFAVSLSGILFFYCRKEKGDFGNIVTFFIVLALSSSLMGIRNYLLVEEIAFMPTGAASLFTFALPIPEGFEVDEAYLPFYSFVNLKYDWQVYLEFARQQPVDYLQHIGKKVLYTFGIVQFLEPDFRNRPHWILIWLGYGLYFVLKIVRGEMKKMQMWEVTLHCYILLYILPLIMFGPISRYAHRLLMPAMGAVFVISFIAYIDVLSRYLPVLRKKDDENN